MVNQRNRNLGAITRGDPDVFATVVRRIKSQDLRLFEYATLSGVHIQFKQRVRCGHGGIAITQARCLRFWIIGKPCHIRRIIKSDTDHFARFTINLSQAG